MKPCPCNKTCCTKPRPYSPHKKCGPKCERICEKAYVRKCRSCKKECACDL